MENICQEIILVTKYKNYIYTSKLRLWVKFFVKCFCGEWNWYKTIKIKTI